jgi:hypothetical protein
MSQMSLTIIVLCLLGQGDPIVGNSTDTNSIQQKKWNDYYAQQAAEYEIRSGDDPVLLPLQPNAVLYWSNPVRIGETNGAVFVWTREGRIEVVGTVFSYLDRQDQSKRVIAHSFHSLSTKPLTAALGNRLFWSIPAAGIQPQEIPGAPPPASLASLRLLQMRELAREFTAASVQDGVERELRLLPQPIYRNAPGPQPTVDGALFTFVTGTDPELMLLIDVRETAAGPRWHYAAARFTDLSAKMWHKQSEVWSYQRDRSAVAGKSSYVGGRVGSRSSVIE